MVVVNIYINSDIDKRNKRQAQVHRRCILILQQAGR